MRFIGVDLAWKEVEGRGRTSVAVIDEGGRLLEVGRAGTDDDIIGLILAAGRPAMVGIDAPLLVPNQAGSRSAERSLLRHGVPVLAANRTFFEGHFQGCRGERLVRRLQPLGYAFADGHWPLPPGSAVIEVYPYTFWRSLFVEVPRYKRGRRGERLRSMGLVRGSLLRALPAPPSSGALGALGPPDLSILDRHGLDLLGDALDATAAALTMLTLARSGEGEDGPTRVFGTLEEGCILASWPPMNARRAGQ